MLYHTVHELLFLQIISAYTKPDTAELNYHAGTAARSLARSVIVSHSGVQFCDMKADEITAVLLPSGL